MATLITLWLLTTLITHYGLLVWFDSTFPVHVWAFAKWIGYRKNDLRYWREFDEHTMTAEDWRDYISLKERPLFAALVCCPICIGFHMALWVSGIVWLCSDSPITFVPAAAFSAPGVAYLFYTKTH